MKQLQLIAVLAAMAVGLGCETTNQTAGVGNQEQKRLAQLQQQQHDLAQYNESEQNLWNAQVDVLNSGTNPAVKF